MTRKLVGLIGVKGAGKDTAAAFLSKLGYQRIAFADALYREAARAYGVSVEFLNRRETKETPLPELALANCGDPNFVEVAARTLVTRAQSRARYMPARLRKKVFGAARSPRWTLQLWGTEYRRKSRHGFDSYWLAQVKHIVESNPGQHYAVTDVRFRNEAELIGRVDGGCLVRIRRPVLEVLEAKNREAKGTAAHPSEVELLAYPTDHEVENVEGHPEALEGELLKYFGALQAAA